MTRAGERKDAVRVRNLTVLHSVDAALKGRVLPIGDGICLGRVEVDGVDVAVDDRLLSRKHASIVPLGTSTVYEIIDHQSRNGSFVDGVRVQRSHITDGSIVRLGITVFELTADRVDAEGAVVAELGADREALVGRSVAFVAMHEQLARAVDAAGPVVIMGESGSGKSHAAGWLHRARGGGPLVTVGCGAGPTLGELELFGGLADGKETEGYLGAAKGGTVLFEEVDLLDADLQPMLLAVLESGSYRPMGSDTPRPLDARVIATTGANLEAAVEAGAFDRTLFEAIAKTMVEVPPLRERRSDVPPLVQHFLRLEEPKRKLDWSATCLEKLLLYDWPLNVRELRSVARRLTMVEGDITMLRSAHLPKEIRRRVHMPTEDALRASAIQVHVAPSRHELQQMLEEYGGDVQKVAEHYAKDRRHVYRWLTRHDLSASDYRKRS